METKRKEFLWRMAKKRACFKGHLRTYLIVIGGLWLIYLLGAFPFVGKDAFPWPIFPMLGWGIGLLTHYLGAYGNQDRQKMVENEYEKLVRSQG
jgi:hypothetical protein